MVSELPEVEAYFEGLKKEFAGYDGEYRDIVCRTPKLLELLLELVKDAENVKGEDRLFLYAAIGYLLDPNDLIPEEKFKQMGYVDDAYVCSWVLNQLIESLGKDFLRETWKGEEDITKVIREVLNETKREITKDVRKSIRSYAGLKTMAR